MTEECTTLSEKSILFMYEGICAADGGITSTINLFLDFVEPQSVTTKGIFYSCYIVCINQERRQTT
jgi:hypothetical protein